MALKKNKVKFGLNKVHFAKITSWSADGVPTFETPVRIPGAVSLSIDANGENENFYADNTVYYVINNNAGYTGDLEIALITTEFATDILGEICILIFAIFMIVYGMQLMKQSRTNTMAGINIRYAYMYLSLPVTGVFYIFALISQWVRRFDQK